MVVCRINTILQYEQITQKGDYESIKRMALGAMVALMMMTSCGTTQTVPLTGRTHRISVSDEQVLSLSNQEYTKYMATAKKSTNAQHTAMVQG